MLLFLLKNMRYHSNASNSRLIFMKCLSEKQEMPAAVPVVEQPADEIQSPVLVPQTFRLPQRLIEDLARAGELRALSWLDQEGNIWLPISSKSTMP
jgi:hypothetical protein